MFGNESFVCWFSTLRHAIVADQEDYKQTILAAVESFKKFEELKGDNIGRFTEDECKFYEEMSPEKLDSDATFRDVSVCDILIKFSLYILGKYRGTKFKKNCSKQLQH